MAPHSSQHTGHAIDSRDEKEFLKAFEAYADALFRHACFRISDRERAYDLTQDTFLKAWDYVAGGGTVKQYKSFLYRILHNLIIDEYRKKKSGSLDGLLEDETIASAVEARLSEGSVRESEEALDEKVLIEKVRSRITELPDAYRIVLTLRFVDGLSIGEIAETVGASENAISVRIHRGIARLRVLCNGNV
ncbi:MAG: RNA polymerase sigma factor [Patescibacteria group bacterium]|nr:RNA polymerase sigma factor [Patescibacteria group bacterium]